MKILLNKYRSKRSANTGMRLNIDLPRNSKILPIESVSATINEEELYQREKSECTKYRLVTTINPVCSNVLHNYITEITVNEGDIACNCLNRGYKPESTLLYKDTWTSDYVYNAIRDTQLSAQSGYTYHCGLDIFNNHILRSQTFKTTC